MTISAQPGAGSFLGSRELAGSLSTVNALFPNPYGVGNYSALFTPQVLAFSANLVQCYHIALTGPAGSELRVYIDNSFYEVTERGDLNSYDPSNPLLLRGGQTLAFHWNTGTGTAPFVTTWWKMPLVGAG